MLLERLLIVAFFGLLCAWSVQTQDAPVDAPADAPVDSAPMDPAPVDAPSNITAPSNETAPVGAPVYSNYTYPPFKDPNEQFAIDAGYVGGFLGLNVVLIVGLIIMARVCQKKYTDIEPMEGRTIRPRD